MINCNIIEQLQQRDLISQISDSKDLIRHLSNKPITLYCGFDPTASSLHVGHLIPLLCLRRFQQAGHKPIALIGGGTGLIGDPSFKNISRQINSEDLIKEWINKIYKQITNFIDFNCGLNSAVILNNYDWFNHMNLIYFLKKIGKYFSVNSMINKEAIKKRLNRLNKGISFTEFSYNLLQGYDFAYLNKAYNVTLQIGGSDQWGNITSGIDLTRRLYKRKVFGITLPLVIKSDGTKFGKTENGTIWLDPSKTSPYKFYQFWINTSDIDVYKFLKFFTFVEIEEIKYMEKNKKANCISVAHYMLAEHITKLVHGKEGLEAAKRITKSLFNGLINNLRKSDFEQLVQDGIPMIEIKKGANLVQTLLDCKLQKSRGQARKAIISNAITINQVKQTDPAYTFKSSDLLFERYTLICRGKKNYCLIYWK